MLSQQAYEFRRSLLSQLYAVAADLAVQQLQPMAKTLAWIASTAHDAAEACIHEAPRSRLREQATAAVRMARSCLVGVSTLLGVLSSETEAVLATLGKEMKLLESQADAGVKATRRGLGLPCIPACPPALCRPRTYMRPSSRRSTARPARTVRGGLRACASEGSNHVTSLSSFLLPAVCGVMASRNTGICNGSSRARLAYFAKVI